MRISNEGIDLIKHFEGCELKSYQCSAGVWTIGYGHTFCVKEGEKITQEAAEELLREDLQDFENYVEKMVEVDLSQNQFDALVSWTFNLGSGNLSRSTLLKVLNAGKHDEVPEQIKRWNRANGKVLEGLKRRREAEAAMWEGNDWKHV
jgi:lysozyme